MTGLDVPESALSGCGPDFGQAGSHFLDVVAHQIGEGTTAQEVEEFLELAEGQRLLVHGVKRARDINGVKTQGVLPLTPEGGPCSYWGSGEKIFYSHLPTRESGMWAFDTPFFHYGPSRTDQGRNVMGLAITDLARLSAGGITPKEAKKNGTSKIVEPVRPSLLTVLSVESDVGLGAVQRTAFRFLLERARVDELRTSGIWELEA